MTPTLTTVSAPSAASQRSGARAPASVTAGCTPDWTSLRSCVRVQQTPPIRFLFEGVAPRARLVQSSKGPSPAIPGPEGGFIMPPASSGAPNSCLTRHPPPHPYPQRRRRALTNACELWRLPPSRQTHRDALRGSIPHLCRHGDGRRERARRYCLMPATVMVTLTLNLAAQSPL